MGTKANSLIGIGLYSVPEAARLTGVSARRIARWVRGYSYGRSGNLRHSPPVLCADAPSTDDTAGLSFLDLMEVRFIDAFREHGVSWKVLRAAAERASEVFGRHHPLSSKRFFTDGRRIFLEIKDRHEFRKEAREPKFIDLVENQYAFKQVLSPTLRSGLEFSKDDFVSRWYPDWPRKSIVVDPAISFGRPTVAGTGVPTEVLAQAYLAEGSEESVARWFNVPTRAVQAAIAFEEALAA